MCNVYAAVDELWGRETDFFPLACSAAPVDDPGTTLDDRDAQAETAVGGVTLVAGWARGVGGLVDTSLTALALKGNAQPPALFRAPGPLQYQRLYAATFTRGVRTVVALRQDLCDGTPAAPTRRVITYQLLTRGQSAPAVPADALARFDLSGPDLQADVMFAPSPSGRLVLQWRGVPNQQLTTDHTVWRTDTGAALLHWAGLEDGGSAAAPRPFRVCKVETTARSIALYKAAAVDNVQSASLIAQAAFPTARLALSPVSLTLTAVAAQAGPPTPVGGTIVIRNDGDDDAEATLGPLAAPFSFVALPPAPLCVAARGRLTLGVRYAPGGTAPADAQFTVTAGTTVLRAALRGRVAAAPASQPAVRLTPDPLTFAPAAGPQRAPVTVVNIGNAPLTVSVAAGASNGFSWTDVPTQTLAPQDSLSVPVRFAPTDARPVVASLPIAVAPLPPQAAVLRGNVVSLAVGDLKILYIDSDPPGADLPQEMITIINVSGRTIDLAGCRLTHDVFRPDGTRRGADTLYTFGPLQLPPFSPGLDVCTVHTGVGVDRGLQRYAGRLAPVWNNAGDTARLFGPVLDPATGAIRERLLDSATYGAGQFWFAGPQPVAPPTRGAAPPLDDQRFTVPESARDWVDTGIDVQDGDRIDFYGSGSVWAGVWLTGAHGPEGWVGWVQNGAQWPYNGMPDAFAFALIGRLGDEVFRIGTRLTRTVIADRVQRLFLWINDDVPGNGSGAFDCRVVVRRA